jgi:predicted RNA binding protein with dsRBD fold (UPF0201 family)
MKNYLSILKLSADAPEELRLVDIDRVLDAANDQRCLGQFIAWLLKQSINDAVRKEVEWYLNEKE